MNNDEIIEKPEEMTSFFDARASSYEDHMRQTIVSFEDFYSGISKSIEYSEEKIQVLDLGCGTGLEIQRILKKVPNAYITGIDVSSAMLEVLKHNYNDKINQISVIKASYTDYKFKENAYDYVVSVMTMHHLLFTEKPYLYKQIKKSLKQGGKYIEGDYIVSPEKEKRFLEVYKEKMKHIELFPENLYHIDIPFSLKSQQNLFLQSGFKEFALIWKENEAAIYVVK